MTVAETMSDPGSNLIGSRLAEEGWAKYESATRKGHSYYFNKKTNKKSWQLPPNLEGEENGPNCGLLTSTNRSVAGRTEGMTENLTKHADPIRWAPVASSIDEVASLESVTSPSYQEPWTRRRSSNCDGSRECDPGTLITQHFKEWKLKKINLPKREIGYSIKILEHYQPGMSRQKKRSLDPTCLPELNEVTTSNDATKPLPRKFWYKQHLSPPSDESPVPSSKRAKLKRSHNIETAPCSTSSILSSSCISDDAEGNSKRSHVAATKSPQESMFSPASPATKTPLTGVQTTDTFRSPESTSSNITSNNDDRQPERNTQSPKQQGTQTNLAERRLQKYLNKLHGNRKQSANVAIPLRNPGCSRQPATVANPGFSSQPATLDNTDAQCKPPSSLPSSLPAAYPATYPTDSTLLIKPPVFDEDGMLEYDVEEQKLLWSRRIALFRASPPCDGPSIIPSSNPSTTSRPDAKQSVQRRASPSACRGSNAVSLLPRDAASGPSTVRHTSHTRVSQQVATSPIIGDPLVGETTDEAMDWEPNVDEQNEMIIDIHQIRKTLRSEELNHFPQSATALITPGQHINNYFIVIDSNILMGHLKFVEHLKDNRYTALEPLVLIIPWAVLQELDKLKDGRRDRTKGTLSANQARLAVNWLHNQFTDNHPRVKSQTAFDLSPIQFACTMADDSILKCCRQLEPFARHVVLLTNDNNLRNKASALQIQAKNRDKMQAALVQLAPSPACARPDVRALTAPVQGRPANVLDSPVNPDAALADSILCDYKTFMLPVLADVLERQMEKAFGNLWTTIVLIKPPWLLIGDVTKNFLKHWLAVSSLAFKGDNRQMQDNFRVLDTFFNSRKGKSYNKTLKDVREVIATSMDICRRLPVKDFGKVIPEYVNKLQEYLTACEGNVAQATSDKNAAQVMCDSNTAQLDYAPEVVPASVKDVSEDFKVIHMTLSKLWDVLCRICVAGCAFFNISHNFGNVTVGPQSKEVISAAIVDTNPLYQDLVSSLYGVLDMPVEELSPTTPCILELHNTLSKIARKYDEADFLILPESVYRFCVSNRALLQKGLREIENFGVVSGDIVGRLIDMEQAAGQFKN